jgi:hypothetical protein
LDSFSFVFSSPVNETSTIDNIFRNLRSDAIDNKYSLLIIDHSKTNEFGKVSIRGGDNKFKFTDIVLKVKKSDRKKMQCIIEVEKSRIKSIIPKQEYEINFEKGSVMDTLRELIVKKNYVSYRTFKANLSAKQRSSVNSILNEEIYNKLLEELK